MHIGDDIVLSNIVCVIPCVDICHIDTHHSTNLVIRGSYKPQVYRAEEGEGLKAQWDKSLYLTIPLKKNCNHFNDCFIHSTNFEHLQYLPYIPGACIM